MNTFKIFSFVFLASFSLSYGQDLNQAKTAIDAEQFEKAKTILKSIIKTKPTEGRAFLLLGNLYLNQNYADSARTVFQNGLKAADGGYLNNIGLGQIELENNNVAGAQGIFAIVTKNMKRKSTEELTYIGRSYLDISKPDYKTAIENLNKAQVINGLDAQVQLALGDAHYGNKDQNNAYSAYRNAFQADNSLIRAKMQLGVLLKGAKSWDEALKAYNEVIAINANYGPVYRELAETYYKWGKNKPSKTEEYMKTAIGYYEKYMSLTDYSLQSRMRHADFLVLVKDYKALEEEANKMKQLDGVNPRILRYLGYAAFENGNIDGAIESLEKYIANPTNKIIARDYIYLAASKIKKGTSTNAADAKKFVMDTLYFNKAVVDLKKALEIEPLINEEVGDLGKKLYKEQKLFKESATILDLVINDSGSKNYVEDVMYYTILAKRLNDGKELKDKDMVSLQKADAALNNIIAQKPDYTEAILYKAQVNSIMESPEMLKIYDQYLAKMALKSPEEQAKPEHVKKLKDAYTDMAIYCANTKDKAKAIEYFNKVLVLDPTNAFAIATIKQLK
jgi:cytochrome c-type biogenesis protein CcmH/NrfG